MVSKILKILLCIVLIPIGCALVWLAILAIDFVLGATWFWVLSMLLVWIALAIGLYELIFQ